MPYTTADKRRVKRLYESGLSTHEVASLPGTPCQRTVAKWAKRGGYARSKSEAERLKQRRLQLKRWRKADALCEAGATQLEAAECLGVGRRTVQTAAQKSLYR